MAQINAKTLTKVPTRFIAKDKDEQMVQSQCTLCLNNFNGEVCNAFGDFPWQYRDALSTDVCPSRKLEL